MITGMYAALIADTAWLADEQTMFRFMIVGLLDEQVRVAQVVPRHTGDEQISTFGARVAWRDSRREWVRRARLAWLADDLDSLRVTVLHALDGRLWDGALQLALRLGLPVVLNVSSSDDLERVARLRRPIAACRTAFCAATAPLGDAIRRGAPDPSLVEVISFGAHVEQHVPPRPLDDTLCIVVTGNGVYDAQYQALFSAMGAFVADHPGAMFFFDGQGSDQHQLWQAARRCGLLSHTSMIPPHAGHRELLSGAHLLIQPQSLGRARNLTIEAMGVGLPVLASRDDWLDYLIDGHTAWLADTPDADDWAMMLRRPIEQPQAAQQLGESAQQWVRDHHLAANQVEKTIQLYRNVTGESYKLFEQDGAASNDSSK